MKKRWKPLEIWQRPPKKRGKQVGKANLIEIEEKNMEKEIKRIEEKESRN